MGDESQGIWNVDMEVNLFHAMRKHKPVGINRHFQMICIHDKLNTTLSKTKLSAAQIWKHLGEMYDLQALNESEIIPFPNKEVDFELPESDFKDEMCAIAQKQSSSSTAARSTVTESVVKDSKDTKETKEASKDSSKEATPLREAIAKGKASVLKRTGDRLAEGSKSEDSPKREDRKRTRTAASSPALHESSAGNTKRARRT